MWCMGSCESRLANFFTSFAFTFLLFFPLPLRLTCHRAKAKRWPAMVFRDFLSQWLRATADFFFFFKANSGTLKTFSHVAQHTHTQNSILKLNSKHFPWLQKIRFVFNRPWTFRKQFKSREKYLLLALDRHWAHQTQVKAKLTRELAGSRDLSDLKTSN